MLVLLLTVLAQSSAPGALGGQTTHGTGGLLRTNQYRTSGTGAQSYFVDPTGSDSNDCTASGTSACLTIQGAVNKIPKQLRDLTTVNLAAGSYACFIVNGFVCDQGVQQSNGGLLFDGLAAFATSTLATGSASGTLTAGSAGSGTTYGTATDGAATWTVNDLRGRFISILTGSGSGQTRVISSNTGTVITIVGTWTAPANLSTYVIQDPGVNITTACSVPNPLGSVTTNNAAVLIAGNACNNRSQSIVVRGVRTSNASGGGVLFSDASGAFLTLSQIRSVGTATESIQVGGPAATSAVSGVGRFDVTDVEVDAPASAAGMRILAGLSTVTRMLVHDGQFGVVATNLGRASIATLDTQTVSNPIIAQLGGTVTSLSGAHIDCSNGADIGLTVGTTAASGTYGPATSLTATTVVVSTCGVGLSVGGVGSSGDVTTLTGAAGTTGIVAVNGGSALFTAATTTITGGTNAINIDSGGVTAALADVTVGSCIATGPQNSRVCAR